jgi:hypothetical protein
MTAPDPPVAVTEAGSLTCTHTGKRPLADLGGGKLTVSGEPVILVDLAASGSYTGCTFTDPATSAPQPCDSTEITVSRTAKLTVAGTTAVLLTSDGVTSFNSGKPVPTAVTVAPGQSKLTAR